MTEPLLPQAGPLVAARTYLLGELAARNNPLPVGVTPPAGELRPYALVSRPGSARRMFLGDYLIRVRVFDPDAVQCEANADLLHGLLLSASHLKVDTPHGVVWVTGATPSMGPTDFTDPASQLFGMQMAVFWTIGLRPGK